jgi:glycosyltransferase involved in cell wall biosynthesis
MFGFCGRLEIEHKGLDLLVEGFAHYASTGGKGKLVIFGTGPAISKIAAMIEELGMSDRIELHGPRFGEEKFRTLRSWDFFIMPSRFDGMPIAALEAALLGLPLIMSPATGLEDLISEFGAGDMIQPLTREGVADAMRRAAGLSADRWHRQSLNAHRMAAGFDWKSVAEELRALYAGRSDTPRLATSALAPPNMAANRA